jgi:tight adherence protein B
MQIAGNTLLIALLIGVGALALLLALLYPFLSGDRMADKRRASLVQSGPGKRVAPARQMDSAQRRKQVADSLKEIELRGRQQAVTLDQRLLHAGLKIGKGKFFLWSGIFGAFCALMAFLFVENPMLIGAAAFVGAFGMPRWVLSFMRNRRLKQFGALFPDAIDVIIRGVKAGLPLLESLRIVAKEFPDPVRTEFMNVIESQTVGLSLTEAVERIAERVPVAEARFFAILIGIQQKSGGNLAEGLGNLSRVLRERKKIAQKIKAMSAEAKASAGIIGSLPFIVATLVYLTSPGYMDMLWLTSEGHTMLLFSAFWMGTGIMVMKKMISFDI